MVRRWRRSRSKATALSSTSIRPRRLRLPAAPEYGSLRASSRQGARFPCRSPTLNVVPPKFPPVALGEGTLILVERSFCRVICAVAMLLCATASSSAAGAFAVGKCGAYGQAYDYPAENSARDVALKQCKGD